MIKFTVTSTRGRVGKTTDTANLRALLPVHRYERRRDGRMASAYTLIHQLGWELIPSFEGVFANLLPGREVPRE